MAKSPPHLSKRAAPSPELPTRTAEEVKAAHKSVRHLYEVGRASLAAMARLPYGKAERLLFRGCRGEKLRKARALASPENGYTERDLEELLAQSERAGYPFCVSMLVKLLGVPKAGSRDGCTRAQLQRQAIRERWSRRQLEWAIRRLIRRERVPPVGRKVRTPSSPTESNDRLVEFCGRWDRLSKALTTSRPPSRRDSSSVDPPQLSKSIRLAVRGVDDAVAKLRTAVEQQHRSRRT